jgi:eukaryotic-like serine/threonine-protein kinase
MLTGTPAFDGASTTETLSRVLEREPDLARLPPATPPMVRRIVALCLEKERDRRLPQIAIAAFQIGEALQAPAGSGAARARPGRRLHAALLIAAALAALVFLVFGTSREPAVDPATRFTAGVAPADEIGGTGGRPTRTAFALSPDGRMLVFAAERNGQRALYVRRFEHADATVIPGTQAAEAPFFSPDGRSVGYWANGEIRRVLLAGGVPVRVTATTAIYGASWAEDDRIVFARMTGGLLEVPAGGGAPAILTEVHRDRGELSHRLPHVLPGGDAVLFTITTNRFPRWDQTQIAVHSRRTGESKVLIEGGADARYAPSGHLVYVREGVLLAAPFEVRNLAVRGGAVALEADVMQAAYFRMADDDTGAGQFAISAGGTLAYIAGSTTPPAERSIVMVDRRGRSQPLPLAPDGFVTLRLSPDERRIALGTFGREREIWLYTFADGGRTALSVPGRNGVPIWSPDGRRITYASGTSGPDALYWVRADSAGAPERLVHSDQNLVPATWTADGRKLLYYQTPSGTEAPMRTMVHDLDGKGPATPIDVTAVSSVATGADLSRDGRWLAYHSHESGRLQVYVQAHGGGGPRYPVSPGGGLSPIWRADGRELFYAEPIFPAGEADPREVRIMVVPVTPTGATLTIGTPRELFRGPYAMNRPARAWDVMGDGQRFLLIHEPARSPDRITGIQIVQHWFGELTRLVSGN